MFKFDNSYRRLSDRLYTDIIPVAVKEPDMFLLNQKLLKELAIADENLVGYLSGNAIPEGAEPIAQAYAGHQFGYFTMLGDGRVIVLGEHIAPGNKRYDVQLKGSGQTPYSRNGDGRATLYSMLREYLISEAMHFLQIPTTRSLTVVTTGEDVYRERIERGAVLTRVAKSHIRVGSFQYVAMQQDIDLLKQFTDYVIERHYPYLKSEENPYLALIQVVMNGQVDLIVNWMRVGFIHGVMNTDNMSISCETIDYGPCAFMDVYNPDTVFSSIDHYGRYSFENQKNIGGWNLARFAETIVPLVDKDEAAAVNMINTVLAEYENIFSQTWNTMMCHKIGLHESNEYTGELVSELLDIMKEGALDYTTTFRNLAFTNISALQSWFPKWQQYDIDYELMKKNNPSVIPRNHIVEEVLGEASQNNNVKPLMEFLEVLNTPYSDDVDEYYKIPPEKVDLNYVTYCGT